jgi:hypothetical protein
LPATGVRFETIKEIAARRMNGVRCRERPAWDGSLAGNSCPFFDFHFHA